MKSQELPYIFLYSLSNNNFESILKEPQTDIINSMRLRARLNNERDIKLYGILEKPSNIIKFNNLLKSGSDTNVFELIKTKLIDIGF